MRRYQPILDGLHPMWVSLLGRLRVLEGQLGDPATFSCIEYPTNFFELDHHASRWQAKLESIQMCLLHDYLSKRSLHLDRQHLYLLVRRDENVAALVRRLASLLPA